MISSNAIDLASGKIMADGAQGMPYLYPSFSEAGFYRQSDLSGGGSGGSILLSAEIV